MEYNSLAQVSRLLGEDDDGVAVWEHQEYHAYVEAIPDSKRWDVRGTEKEGTTFVAFPELVEVKPGDILSSEGETLTVLSVSVIKHPATRRVIHTEVIGG
jgi:hypothetical protein